MNEGAIVGKRRMEGEWERAHIDSPFCRQGSLSRQH